MPKKQMIAVLMLSATIPTDHTTKDANLVILAIDGRVWVNIAICKWKMRSMENFCFYFKSRSLHLVKHVYGIKVVTKCMILLSDDDECTSGKHNCSEDAMCNNNKGSYNCKYKTGYSGSGWTCNSKIDLRRLFCRLKGRKLPQIASELYVYDEIS